MMAAFVTSCEIDGSFSDIFHDTFFIFLSIWGYTEELVPKNLLYWKGKFGFC